MCIIRMNGWKERRKIRLIIRVLCVSLCVKCILQLKKACENGDAAILRSCLKTNPGLDIDALEDEVCVGENRERVGEKEIIGVFFFLEATSKRAHTGKNRGVLFCILFCFPTPTYICVHSCCFDQQHLIDIVRYVELLPRD